MNIRNYRFFSLKIDWKYLDISLRNKPLALLVLNCFSFKILTVMDSLFKTKYNSLNNDAGVTNLGKQTGHLKLWLNAESKLSECSTLQFQYFHQLEYLWMLCMTSVCRRSRRHVFIIPNIRELHMHCNNISIKPLFDKQH